MKVVLAGYNVDRESLDEVRRSAPGRLDLTPETLSAAYARISRDPRPVDELRRAARAEVEKARRSNRTIIFKMGHHSVAEHAVFNFDIMGVSRLAIEEIEKFRLGSFTEKSQRYIKLGSDFVVPEEIVAAGKKPLFIETIRAQNSFYHALYEKLRPYVFKSHPEEASDPDRQSVLDGWAKEDARYAVSLATEGQLGLTVNARSLELMIRRFAASALAEIRALGRRLAEEGQSVAPSILLFTGATPYDAETTASFREAAGRELVAAPARLKGGKIGASGPDVRLLAATPDADIRILTALLHAAGTRTYSRCRADVRRLSPRRRKELFLRVFEKMEFYDAPPREFEQARLTFELMISASCFAQLKRHRMATMTAQEYFPDLGFTLPSSIEAVGEAARFRDMIDRTNKAYAVLKRAAGPAAAYVLTNAHRRRVLMTVNARELYHIARLREDASAQWDIRRIAAEMSRLARTRMPLSGMLLCGKDAYAGCYESIFGRLPKVIPPKTDK